VLLDNSLVNGDGVAVSGRYAILSVMDTGVGMNQQVIERIFEPFYTTKEIGSGSGLGLSMAYGIIQQHNGFIKVFSKVNSGSVFKIYLPALNGVPVNIDKEHGGSLTYPGGAETVLLAEDDDNVRHLIKRALEKSGYSVIEATDGEDAIRKFTESRDVIDVLIADVIMPKKNGRAVFDEINRIKQGLNVLFISGYTADILNKKGIIEDNFNLLLKPFSVSDLLEKLRDVMGTRIRHSNPNADT